MSLKAPPASQPRDGTGLRVAIVHARWNMDIIEPLVEGARRRLLAQGVKEGDIVVQTCPGSWELPLAVQRVVSAAQMQSTATGAPSATDLLASSAADLASLAAGAGGGGALDAVIAVGVLIKGETMHFEYIADAVGHGLMRVQLDAAVPVVFGVLTVLDEDQAKARAGLVDGSHNHGEAWGDAAVEMGLKRRQWASGNMDS
ncbi:hypothetical protein CDD83_10327 [Cordyceps sp. RAO-2017]|nr:hypothetical protein CDD83_10327 [Cordyceps sp. RAO-2017]